MTILDELRMYARIARALPRFLRRPATADQARAQIRKRMRERKENFLRLAREAIYGWPGSPYLRLLEAAGCEFGDLEKLVNQEGLEGALSCLRGAGVYISIEEFKGRKEAKRGSQTFHFAEEDFDNPKLAPHFSVHSGGTRGKGTQVIIDLDFVSALADATALFFHTHALSESPFAIWQPIGGNALVALMTYTRAGRVPSKWFSQIDPVASGLSFKYRTGTKLMLQYGRLFGTKLPFPEFVPVFDSMKIAAWIGKMLKQEGSCLPP